MRYDGQLITQFTIPQKVQNWVNLGGWLHIPRWLTCLQTVTHPSTTQVQCETTL